MMNQALHTWREEFDRQPVDSLDRLIRGVVALGSVSQLSIGELLDLAFEPEDEALDAAVKTWLADRILRRVPEGMTPSRWTAVLDESLRGIATLGLPQTGQLLREEHSRIRLWLRGLYEGPDRDPEGSYLLALAYCQSDQRFSQLWRRLVLGEELAERPYRDIGLLGFRKMPDAQGRPAADVPVGLIQVLLELASRQVVKRDEWLQIVRSIFAAYRRTEDYWIRHFRDAINSMLAREKHIDDWLATLLPHWHKGLRENRDATAQHAIRPIPIWESLDWVQRVAKKPDLCETNELELFLDRHRVYARTTGDSQYLVKTFNNLAARVIAADRSKASCAVRWIKEALDWERTNSHNWTVYAKVLWAANRRPEAKDILWEARQRIPWNRVVRNELGRLLRNDGELVTSASVYREAASHFPNDAFCRNGLAETLRQMGQLEEARKVYEQTCKDFPNDAVCRERLADLLIGLADPEQADTVHKKASGIEMRETSLQPSTNPAPQESLGESDRFASNAGQTRESAAECSELLHGCEPSGEQQRPTMVPPGRTITQMSVAERLGRAMIALWEAERASSQESCNRLCDQAERYLDVPESEADRLLTGFVETRGLVMLARGDARAALDYFREQIDLYGRGGWIGVRLGEQRARLKLGEPAGSLSDETPFDSENAHFAVQVANVIRRLAANANELEVGELLGHLYPRAASLAEKCTGNTGEGEGSSRAATDEAICGAGMIAAFIQAKWFRPTGITSPDDLDDPQRLNQVFASIRETQNDAFDVLSNAGIALAA